MALGEGSDRVRHCYENGEIEIGWGEIGSLAELSKEEIGERLNQFYPIKDIETQPNNIYSLYLTTPN